MPDPAKGCHAIAPDTGTGRASPQWGLAVLAEYSQNVARWSVRTWTWVVLVAYIEMHSRFLNSIHSTSDLPNPTTTTNVLHEAINCFTFKFQWKLITVFPYIVKSRYEPNFEPCPSYILSSTSYRFNKFRFYMKDKRLQRRNYKKVSRSKRSVGKGGTRKARKKKVEKNGSKRKRKKIMTKGWRKSYFEVHQVAFHQNLALTEKASNLHHSLNTTINTSRKVWRSLRVLRSLQESWKISNKSQWVSNISEWT